MTPFYIARRKLKTDRVMFHMKHIDKGYYSADSVGETFPVIASDRGIKGYKKVMGKTVVS